MHNARELRFSRLSRAGFMIAVLLLVLWTPAGARAQGSYGGLVIPGGYFFTSSSASDNLGNPLFYHEGTAFGYSFNLVAVQLSVGIDIISVNDSFVAFAGDNEFDLIGPGVNVGSKFSASRLRPFFATGLYAGRVKSEDLDIDKWDFTPSTAFGVDILLAKSLFLRTQYRLSEHLSGINTDGFSVMLRVF